MYFYFFIFCTCPIVHTSFKVSAAIIRLSSEGAFGGSLRCNKFWSGHLARFGSFEFQPIVLFLWSRVASLPAREPSGRSHPARVPSAAGSFPPIAIFSWSRVSLACCRGSHSNNKAATAPSIAFYCPLHCALCQLRFYCRSRVLPPKPFQF